MRDAETGTWWQQVTGEAIQGPRTGSKLKAVGFEEISFATWRKENPQGRVLRPDEQILAQGKYEADWETSVAKMPVTIDMPLDERLPPREIVLGVTLNGADKAYPLNLLRQQSPIMDMLGGRPIMVLLNKDGDSVRAFERTLDGQTLEFFAKTDTSELRLTDAATGSEWDFTGTAVHGSLAGKRLTQIPVLKDFWFDWHTYHPQTMVYLLR